MTPTNAAIQVISDVMAQDTAEPLFEVSNGGETFERNGNDYHCTAPGLVNAILDELGSRRVAIEYSSGGMPMRACRWDGTPTTTDGETP